MPKGWLRPLAKTDTCCGLPSPVDAAQDLDVSALALGEEEVAVGRGADEARVVESAGVEIDFEARGRLGPGIRRTRNHLWSVVDGFIRIGFGQIGDGELVTIAGSLLGVVGEGCLPGENGGAVGCGEQWRWKKGSANPK